MQNSSDELLRTRTTLIQRLGNWKDDASWQEFFDTYWRLIYSVALRSGLSGTEAQDVVQETMVSVAKHMPNFKYDRAVGSFKAWLLNMTRWRITDQFRKRGPASHSTEAEASANAETLDNFADPAVLDLEAVWDTEWKKTLVEAATAKVKRSLDPQQYQIFDFYVNKEWAPAKIATTFGVPVERVYLTKSRVRAEIREEVERLKKVMN